MQAFNQTRQTLIASDVQKAHSMLKRMKGLLGKKHMPENFGMWISPCSSIHTFFMKFSIDVVFLSPDHQVVKVLHSFAPFRLSSWVNSSQSVLELAGGVLQKTGTQVGDQVVFRS
ncbi:MAG: DUF192 domain-containing protein [Proteobacteria bacterium]|jgi:uncharacterized membrane protein (UPF0127 family)|nr:DUF192 domain-containing protein [Pseudomonadota bacterium]